MRRLPAILLVGGSALFGMSTSAHAQLDTYPPRSLSVTQDLEQVAPGDMFAVTLTGCLEGETVVFDFVPSRKPLNCDVNSPLRALVSTDTPLGTATAHFVAPPTTGRFVGTVSLGKGRTVGDFEILVVDPATGAVPVNAQAAGVFGAFGATGAAGATAVANGAGASGAAGSAADPAPGTGPATVVIFAGVAAVASLAVFMLRPQLL